MLKNYGINNLKLFEKGVAERNEMPEKRTRTAIEMAASIGSNPAQLDQNWQTIGALNLSLVIKELGQELGLSNPELWQMLVQTSAWLMGTLDQKIISIEKKAIEQSTAIELRKNFGAPLSLLAMPVFIELEKIELLSRLDLKNESSVISQLWEQLSNKILYSIQLFLAEQINLLENESLAHQQALSDSKSEAEKANGALGETMQIVEKKFISKITEIERKKQGLLKTFLEIKNRIIDPVRKTFEVTVFQSAQQKLVSAAIN